MKSHLAFALLGIIALAGLTIHAHAAEYFVSTDQQTYAPGDTITVTGKVPLPEPKISALSGGVAYAPNHYQVTVASTMNLAVPQNLGLADCQYFDFDNLPSGLYDAERNAGGPAQEQGKYYRYYHATPQDASSDYIRAECGFASDGTFTFTIDSTGQTDGKYKVGYRASQDILMADGSKLDSKDWNKSTTYKIRTGATPAPEPEPDPPTVVSAKITSPNKVTIKFSEKVTAPKSAFSDFTVTGEDKSRKILSKSGSNSKTVTLTVGGKAISLDATASIDISGKVKNKAGVKLVPLDDYLVTDGQDEPATLEELRHLKEELFANYAFLVFLHASDELRHLLNDPPLPEWKTWPVTEERVQPTITIDKTTYRFGDTVRISGNIGTLTKDDLPRTHFEVGRGGMPLESREFRINFGVWGHDINGTDSGVEPFNGGMAPPNWGRMPTISCQIFYPIHQTLFDVYNWSIFNGKFEVDKFYNTSFKNSNDWNNNKHSYHSLDECPHVDEDGNFSFTYVIPGNFELYELRGIVYTASIHIPGGASANTGMIKISDPNANPNDYRYMGEWCMQNPGTYSCDRYPLG